MKNIKLTYWIRPFVTTTLRFSWVKWWICSGRYFFIDSQKSTPNESSSKKHHQNGKSWTNFSFWKRLKVCVDVKSQHYANSLRRDKIVNWMLHFSNITALLLTVYTAFLRVDVYVAKYFWQWNAQTDQVTISYELLSVDNFASFYPILTNISPTSLLLCFSFP